MKYRLGDLTIDTGRQMVSRGSDPVPLPKLSFDLLLALVRATPNVVSLDELMRLVWPGVVVGPETVSQRVKLLRDSLGDDSRAPRYIGGLRGRGYQIVGSVSEVIDTPAAAGTTESLEIVRDSGVQPTPLTGALIAPAADATGPGHAFVSTEAIDPLAERRGPSLTQIERPPEAAAPLGLGSANSSEAREWSLKHAQLPQDSIGRAGRSWMKRSAWLVVGAALISLIIWQTRDARKAGGFGTSSGKVTLAVLPFQNLSNDPGQEYLSDGLTEETITDLGELSPERLAIIARTSAMVFKNTKKSVAEIGRSLGADYLLEGSIRREGNAVRVSAQLIRVNDQSHLWVHTYDRELVGLLALQKELGRAIAQGVQVKLAPNYARQAAERYIPNPEAYELYLQGLYYLGKRAEQDLKRSVEYFERSTEKDGGFALAYAGLASAELALGFISPKDSYPKAAVAASRALDLDDGLAEAHAALGAEKAAFEYDWQEAEVQLRRAIALNPNSAYAHLLFSEYYLTPRGRFDEAISEMRKGLELDPLSPLFNTLLGQTYYFARQYEKSLAQYNKALQLNPDFFVTHAQLVWLYVQLEEYPNAIAEMAKTRLLTEVSTQKVSTDESELQRAFAAQGSQGFWQQIRVIQQDRWFPGGFFPAQIAARLGEPDVALELLQRGYEQRLDFVNWIQVDPNFDSLRSDPRFALMLQRLGFGT
jgi:TolB-like protein/DNA-binding winged helix-turn-helix (wHTH) protein/Flp pilus assembly protein TadD